MAEKNYISAFHGHLVFQYLKIVQNNPLQTKQAMLSYIHILFAEN